MTLAYLKLVAKGRNNDSPGKQQKGILPVNHVQRLTHLIVGYEFSNTLRQKELTLVAGSINQPYWWIFISFEACHYFFILITTCSRADDVSHSCHGLLWWVWWNVALLQSIFLGYGSDSSNCSHCLAAATSIVPLTCDTVMYCWSECDYTNPQCLLAWIWCELQNPVSWYRVLCLCSWLVPQHHLLLGSLYSFMFSKEKERKKRWHVSIQKKRKIMKL